MKSTKSIFQSPSWEELVQSTNNPGTSASTKKRGSHNPKQLVNKLTQRVRSIRRYRFNNTFKSKPSIEKCSASDLLSHSASTIVGKVLTASTDFSETLSSQRTALTPFSSKLKSYANIDDDMSDISASSMEDETSDPCTDSSMVYIWILGMKFVVFDSSITNIY
jgi:hypothetical protein